MCLLLALIAVSAATAPAQQPESSPNDIQFKVPDVTTQYVFNNKTVTLEAYRVVNRTQWVSVGRPYLTKHDTNSTYSYTPEGIHAHIRLLDPSQKLELLKAARMRHPSTTISDNDIGLIPLQRFGCKAELVQDGKRWSVTGTVHDFNTLEPTMDLLGTEEGSQLRTVFTNRVERSDNIVWRCTLAGAGKESRTNSIRITSSQTQWINLQSAIFGPAGETYVSRQQLNNLAQQVRSEMYTEEMYEYDDEAFENEFKNRLLSLASTSFQQVDVDEALSKLSKFGLEGNARDIAPSEIKRELNSQMVIKTEGGKRYIAAASDARREGSTFRSSSTDVHVNAKADVFLVVDAEITTDVKYAQTKASSWKNSDKNEHQQLEELNSHRQSGTKWEIEGNRVVAKSLNLAKMSKTNLRRDIVISGVKTKLRDAAYVKMYELRTAHETRHTATSLAPTRRGIQLYVATEKGIQTSNNDGRTWETLLTFPPPATSWLLWTWPPAQIAVTSNGAVICATLPGGADIAVSRDYGRTWEIKSQRNGFPIENLVAQIATDGNKIYLGGYPTHTGGREVDEARPWNAHLYVLGDAGMSWTKKPIKQVTKWNSPTHIKAHRDRICVNLWDEGLSISDDGGNTWKSTLKEARITSINLVGQKIYAYVHYARSTLYVSEDGGSTWSEHPGQIPTNDILIVNDTTFYAVYSSKGIGIGRSTDAGQTWKWQPLPTTFPCSYRNLIYFKIHTLKERVYIATPCGILVSIDSGSTWNVIATPQGLLDNTTTVAAHEIS